MHLGGGGSRVSETATAAEDLPKWSELRETLPSSWLHTKCQECSLPLQGIKTRWEGPLPLCRGTGPPEARGQNRRPEAHLLAPQCLYSIGGCRSGLLGKLETCGASACPEQQQSSARLRCKCQRSSLHTKILTEDGTCSFFGGNKVCLSLYCSF